MAFERDLNLEATELRLGLPGTQESRSNKRSLPDMNIVDDQDHRSGSSRVIANASNATKSEEETTPPSKTQVVGWPPIRSYRKNSLQAKKSEAEASGIYVKVSMDGAPYLRKIHLNIYKDYPELLKALEDMFKFKVGKFIYTGSSFHLLHVRFILNFNLYQTKVLFYLLEIRFNNYI
ncbi:auxin-responsive protein IAA4 [Citrus sinensis]|uniref:Auxin-responsive protein IAA4 n=1 Tax=Citrus sinensis TaxID=2711 RepID=A0ACB8KHT2_CITSI|nr:auxin-responsive protein IAA4 [Citrus sinensis]